MEVRIKKLVDEAVIPEYAKPGDAGMDLVAVSRDTDEYGNIVYGTGLAFEIPEGYVGMLFSRSSVSKKTLSLCNCTGILDSGYRGEVLFKFKPTLLVGDVNNDRQDDPDYDEYLHEVIAIPGENLYSNPHVFSYEFEMYEVGDKIGQIIIMPYPHIEFKEVDELSDTERGTGGFGSTGS